MPEAFPGVELHGEVLEPVQPDNFVPMMPEIGGQEPESISGAIAPAPDITQPASVSEEPTPQEESSTAAAGEVTTLVLPHEEVEEEAQARRGFLSRLLRRGTD